MASLIPFDSWCLKYEEDIDLIADHFEALVRKIHPGVLPGALFRMRRAFLQRLYHTSDNTDKYFV